MYCPISTRGFSRSREKLLPLAKASQRELWEKHLGTHIGDPLDYSGNGQGDFQREEICRVGMSRTRKRVYDLG